MMRIRSAASALILFVIASSECRAQPTLNLNKYWTYRERLKNFVVSDDCQGCGIPAVQQNNKVSWDDSTITLGHYLAVLATEYKLRQDHGQSVAATVADLFFALKAFERVDFQAEKYWRWEWSNQPSSVSQPSDLNGFFIRDDVAESFFNSVVQGTYVENLMTNSKVPLDDGRRRETVDSGYTSQMGKTSSGFFTGNGRFLGPREESLDQVVQLLVGLGLVAKLVDPSVNFGSNTFLDGETQLAIEARNAVARMTAHMQPFWRISNPVTGECVKGVFWQGGLTPLDPSKCNAGGSQMALFAHGYAVAVCATVGCSPALMLDGVVQAGTIPWQNLQTVSMQGEDEKVLALAALGNVWGTATAGVLAQRAPKGYWEHLALLHQVLWGGGNPIPDSLYECLLDSAPCRGTKGYIQNYEWSGGKRILYGPNINNTAYSDDFYGLDYMLYFNLYNLSHPSYLGSNYRYIRPEDLCVADIVKENYVEYDEKNFFAANSIQAGNVNGSGVYTIKNDANSLQPLPAGAARVTFAAGNRILLKPGFSIITGANFHAYIDATLKASSCGQETSDRVCGDCEVSGNEYDNIPLRPTTSYWILPIDRTDIFVVGPHTLYKVRREGLGPKMFGVDPGKCKLDDTVVYIGHNKFDATITGVVYAGRYTFVSFDDGRILKVNGTGGSGSNMFAITLATQGFDSLQGYNYYSGSHKFNRAIDSLTAVGSELLIAFPRGLFGSKLLKVNLGGSGANVFAIQETVDGFTSLSGYGYYQGHSSFHGRIADITNAGNETFVSFKNGKILKITGTGGTGANMFAIQESTNGFTSLSGYDYYLGHQNFGSNTIVTAVRWTGAEIMFGFTDGRFLKVVGTGGTGINMFNAVKVSGGFAISSTSFTNYVLGSHDFSNILTGSYVTTIGWSGSETLVGFHNGKILKAVGTGGTGMNMFNISSVPLGFQSGSGTIYLLGSTNFNITVSQVLNIFGVTYISLADGRIIKIRNTGGTGLNMFGLVRTGRCYKGLCGGFYYMGCQDLGSATCGF